LTQKLVAITGKAGKEFTYRPMTDCFFGASVLMMATDDR